MRVGVMAAPSPQQVARGVYLITLGIGPASSWWPANAYVVRSDSTWWLIDTGWPGRAAAIKTAAESLCGQAARPAAILLTHIHPDHSGSAGPLARSWEVPVYVHPAELPMASGRYLPQYTMPLDRWLIVPLMRLLPSRTRERLEAAGSITDVVRPLDQQRRVPGMADWVWVPTPGHTPGSVARAHPGFRRLSPSPRRNPDRWGRRPHGGSELGQRRALRPSASRRPAAVHNVGLARGAAVGRGARRTGRTGASPGPWTTAHCPNGFAPAGPGPGPAAGTSTSRAADFPAPLRQQGHVSSTAAVVHQAAVARLCPDLAGAQPRVRGDPGGSRAHVGNDSTDESRAGAVRGRALPGRVGG